MRNTDAHWGKLTEEQWQHLAEEYLLEIHASIEAPEAEVGTEQFDKANRWGLIVMELGLWGPPQLLWNFILRVTPMAETDPELGEIAAGVIEYLLGRAGDEFIDAVERQANTDAKFARAPTGCNQYLMTD